MTSTSWQRLLGFSAGTVLVAACAFSSGSDDDDGRITTGAGGIGGSTSGGTGGTSDTGGTGGSAGEGGSGGTTTTSTTNTTSTTGSATGGTGGTSGNDEVECLDGGDGDVPGEPASEDVDDDDACCWKCAASVCYDKGYAECFASEPNICGGSVGGDGSDSEILTLIDCMRSIDGGALPGTDVDSDFDICIGEATTVSSDVCGKGTISGPTNELALCLAGDQDGLDGCFEECFNAEFDEDECLY